MNPIARYTRFVALSKRSLWALVAAMIALVVWIASDNTGANKARIVFSGAGKSEETQSVMTNPHYQGMDAKNQPFTIVADQATQIDDEHVALKNIRADLSMVNGKWVAVTAGSGVMSLGPRQLELQDGVEIFYDGGYEFRTARASIDIKKGTAEGDSPIEGQGPLGILKAKRFSIKKSGKVIIFNGSVRMKLYR